MNSFVNELFFYPTPNNFNYFYCVGIILSLLLLNQLFTGVLLACYYVAAINIAFISYDYIVRDIKFGWIISFMHSNGASFFLSFIYIHIVKSICYYSFQIPKHNLWLSGFILYLFIMSGAFLGYILPWGQMSFWGATVIINFLTVIPYIGEIIAYFVWGGFNVCKATLVRFFSLHFLIGLIISFIVVLHMYLLHQVGSSNPLTGGNIKECIKLSIYFKLKDMLGLIIISSSIIELLLINYNLGHTSNYILASSLITPEHIVPEWYFLWLYAILRAIPNKLFGIISMFSLIINFVNLLFLME